MSDEYIDAPITAADASAGMGSNVDAGGWNDPIDMYVDWGGWGTDTGGAGVDLSGGTGVANWASNSTGGVAPGAAGSSWWDSVSKWATEGTGKDKKGPSILAMAMPTLLSAGMGAVGEALTGAKKEARENAKKMVAISQQNADSNTARVAQTSHGSSVPTIKKKTGLINQFHPVTVQRPTGVA